MLLLCIHMLQAPSSMRSVTQSLNLFTNALGSFLVIPLLMIVNSNPGEYLE